MCVPVNKSENKCFTGVLGLFGAFDDMSISEPEMYVSVRIVRCGECIKRGTDGCAMRFVCNGEVISCNDDTDWCSYGKKVTS